jgi:ubiquinone/menaquinone biosynthesis C-methylase UbiE
MNEQTYLNMQKNHYENQAQEWSLQNRDPVVGSYDLHNNWEDYNQYLFKNFDTAHLTALEYGCGPGRNIIKFNNRFSRIDGVDIAQNNLEKAQINLSANNINNSILYLCDGKNIPVDDESYDVVFSVICLQHIACYDIRFSIFSNIKRVLKPNGYFCFQMGLGGRPGYFTTADYYENAFDATSTNSGHDVSIENEDYLKDDLITKLGFKNYQSDIRPTGPGDTHANWIWVQVQK